MFCNALLITAALGATISPAASIDASDASGVSVASVLTDPARSAAERRRALMEYARDAEARGLISLPADMAGMDIGDLVGRATFSRGPADYLGELLAPGSAVLERIHAGDRPVAECQQPSVATRGNFLPTGVWPEGFILWDWPDETKDLLREPPDEPTPNDINRLLSAPNSIAAMLYVLAETEEQIKWVGWDAVVYGNRGYVLVDSNGPEDECFNAATVGYAGIAEQFFSICNWDSFPVVIHEMGHTMGLFHEHSRGDRDDFIEFHPENVVPGQQSQFAIETSCRAFGEYDFFSVMHYFSTAFSINGLETLEVLPPNEALTAVIGTGLGYSDGDIEALFEMYGQPGDDIPWRLDITSRCPADVDRNGYVNVNDLRLFLDLLNSQSIYADLNGDCIFDFTDFVIFRSFWIPGFCFENLPDEIQPDVSSRPVGIIR